jgi:integrase
MAKRRMWGSGEVIPPAKPGATWAVRWRENGVRRFKGRIRSKVEADRLLAKIRGDLAMDRAGLPRDARALPRLDELANEWLKRREHTHVAWSGDRGNWRNHLEPYFGKLRASEVDTAAIRTFVEAKLRERAISKTTIGLCIRELSTFFSDLCERPRETGATANPVRAIPRSLRRLYKSDYDHRFTPYLRTLADVRRLYQALPKPVSVMYALGVCTGMRTGEVLAIDWDCIDLAEPRIVVRFGRSRDGGRGMVKDREARILRGEFLLPLVPILKAWRLESGGSGLVFPPPRGARRSARYFTPHRLYEGFDPVLADAELGLPELKPHPFYQATRHTFASHWVQAGHPIAGLAAVLGHSTTWVTERYAHAEHGGRAEDPWQLDLLRGDAPVVSLENGQKMATRRSGRNGKSLVV